LHYDSKSKLKGELGGGGRETLKEKFFQRRKRKGDENVFMKRLFSSFFCCLEMIDSIQLTKQNDSDQKMAVASEVFKASLPIKPSCCRGFESNKQVPVDQCNTTFSRKRSGPRKFTSYTLVEFSLVLEGIERRGGAP